MDRILNPDYLVEEADECAGCTICAGCLVPGAVIGLIVISIAIIWIMA
jgi:hypothetical protein